MCFLYHLFFLPALSSFVHDSIMSSSSDQSNLCHPMPCRTACLQYSHLTHTPSPFCLLFTRPRTMCSRCPFLLTFLFLSGDIELNPGPVNFALCTLNIRCNSSPSPTPKGAQPAIFGPYLLRLNGCMDQHATWYTGRPRSMRLCVRWRPHSPPNKGTEPRMFGPCLLWPNGRMDQHGT